MSALLLLFALRSNDLFDDLESFLHVLEVMGLRFHHHKRSPTICTPDGKVTVDITRNPVNQWLGRHVVTTYFQTVKDNWGNLCGTDNKLLRLQTGLPAVSYEHETAALTVAIEQLHELFSDNYRTVNQRAWRRMWGDGKPREGDAEEIRRCKLFDMTHDSLQAILDPILDNDELMDVPNPKTDDQFNGIPGADGLVLVKASTGGSARLASSRHLSEDRPAKKARTASD